MPVIERELDGQDLKRAFEAAKVEIEQHIDEVNALNVFPVPDGDTGINMFLTIKAAVRAIEQTDDSSAANISALAARGALMGARGNSGVILSQIMKGMAKGLEEKEYFSFPDFADALNCASEQAYKVVVNPVEGTMLTVIREVSEEASSVSGKMISFGRAIVSVVRRARETVKRTPEMLPVLKEAGVVDSGAKGLYYFFKGMENAICRKNTRTSSEETSSRKVSTSKEEERHYGFDVQFLLEGKDLPVEEIRERVVASGECPLVAGDETLVKVHVHTMNPDEILNYARSKGTLQDIIVEDMDMQVQGQIQKKGGPSRG